jgi:hypothetical protein
MNTIEIIWASCLVLILVLYLLITITNNKQKHQPEPQPEPEQPQIALDLNIEEFNKTINFMLLYGIIDFDQYNELQTKSLPYLR